MNKKRKTKYNPKTGDKELDWELKRFKYRMNQMGEGVEESKEYFANKKKKEEERKKKLKKYTLWIWIVLFGLIVIMMIAEALGLKS